MKGSPIHNAALFTAASLSVVSPATAQDGEPEADIVVTAQRREQRLQDVPVSVSVISGAAVSSGNIRNLEELSSRLPNVRISSSPLVDLVNIRGVGSGQNSGFEQSVATFVDGVYRGRARATRAALFDIEQIEVLRGPQTTFFGNNAIAGALNITTRRPGDALEYNASALYGSDNEYALEGGISVPLTATFRARAALKLSGMDGFIHNRLLSQDGPRMRDALGRISLVWEPSDEFESLLRYDRGRFRSSNAVLTEAINCPPATAYGAARGGCATALAQAGGSIDNRLDLVTTVPPSTADYDFWELAFINKLRAGGHVITSTTSYFDHDYRSLFHRNPLAITGIGGGPSSPVWAPELASSFSQELRIESDSSGPIEYMVGAYFARGELETRVASGFYYQSFGQLAAPTYDENTPIVGLTYLGQKDRTISAFGSVTWHILPPVQINLGARYATVRKEGHRTVRFGVGVPGTLLAPNRPDVGFVEGPLSAQQALATSLGATLGDFLETVRTDDKFQPSVGLQWKVSPGLNAYAAYSKGFKAGGFGLSAFRNVFGPETVDAYEIGLKGSAFDRRLNFNIAGYLSDYADFQESTVNILPNGSIQTIVANASSVRAKGIEAGLSARVVRGLNFNADVAYLDSHYRNFPSGPCTVLQSINTRNCVQNLSGKRRAFAPEFSGNVGLTAEVPFGDFVFKLAPSLYFTTRYFQSANADPLFEQPAYVKFDLRAAISDSADRWEIAFVGKNLNDEITASFRQSLTGAVGSFFAIPERGRSVALQITFKN